MPASFLGFEPPDGLNVPWLKRSNALVLKPARWNDWFTPVPSRLNFGVVIVRSNVEWSSFRSYRENFGGRNIMWETKMYEKL